MAPDESIEPGLTSDERRQNVPARAIIESLIRLHEIASDPKFNLNDRIKNTLQLGSTRLGLPIAILGRIDGDQYIVEQSIGPDGEPAPGTTVNLEDTYLALAMGSNYPIGFHNIGQSELSSLPAYKLLKFESYLGVRIDVDNKTYGTLSFVDHSPQELPFTGADYAFMQLLGIWVSNEISRATSEKRFHSAVERLQGGFALYDADDVLVICNEEFRRLHPESIDILLPGMRYEDMLRNNVAQGVVPGAIGREEEYIKERLELHRHPSGPLVRQWTDGTWRLIREIRTPDGGLAVSQTDITELKTIENTVRQSDAQFRALLDNVPAQITLRDKDGRYLVANKVLEERHELKVDDIIGEKNLHGSAHGNDSDFIEKWDQIIDKHFHQVIETGEVSTETRRVVLFDGSEIDSLVTKFPVFDETGDLIQVGSISVDVTERIKAEQALRQSEENFRALIDNMPASLTLRDQQGRYIAVNRGYEEQHNLKAEDLVGQSREEVFDRSIEEVSSAEQQVQDVFKTGQAITLPRHKVNSDGSTSDYEVIKYPIFDDSGKVVQIGGIGIDVTERTKAEEALRQSEARFQGAIKSLQEGFALFDADDRLITFNDEYVRLHEGIRDIIKPGVFFAEICRANVMRGINLTAQGWEEDYIKQRLEERKNPANEPITLQMANGLWFMFRESRTPEGGLVSTYTNVSELKNIENELLVNQERLDAALEGANEILWDWQLQDGDFYIDPRLEQHLGYPLGSLQPHINTWNDIVHPDD